MDCRACEEPNRPGARFCANCSAPLATSCYGCGGPVSAEGELCTLCRTERIEPMSVDTAGMFPGPAEDVTAITAVPYELRPRFMGRRGSLDRILRVFGNAVDLGELGFVVIIGEPGMGKSRLVKETTRAIRGRRRDTRFLLGYGDDRATSYAAFADVLAGRFGIVDSDPVGVQREKLIAGVTEVLPAARVTEVAHLLAHLMGTPFPNSPVVEPLVASPQQLEARTFIATRRFLAADAARGPLVIAIENLEQCGPETINLLHYLAAGLSDSPVLIMATARALLYERHPSFGDGDVPLERIELGPLDDEEARELMRELCRHLDQTPAALIEHATRLKGSPRAVLELVRYLLESDVIVRSGPMSWRIDDDKLAAAHLPDDHEQLMAARLEVMAADERRLLEMAAAVGESFWLDSVVALVRVSALHSEDPDGPNLEQIASQGDATRASVVQSLTRLVASDWVVEADERPAPGEREYRFAYPQLWSAAYRGISESARRRYHGLIAQWLELRPDSEAAAACEEVGRHLELAGDARGAAARYRAAADLARAAFLNGRAIRLYARALTCLGEADLAERIRLWHDLGSVYELKGDFEAALGAFERMLRLAWVVASRTKAAVAFNKMGRVWRRKGDLALALEYLQRGQELFEQGGDARGVAASLDDIGSVMYLLGRFDEAYDKVTKSLAARGREGDPRSIAHSLSNLGTIQKDRGRFNEAKNCHTEALSLRRSIGDRAGVVGSLNNLAVLAYEKGDWQDARTGWQQALHEAEEIGALPLQAMALNNLGELARHEGRPDEARSRLSEALQIAEEIDDRRLQSEALRNLALLELASGGMRSRELGQRALEIARSAGLRDHEGRCLLAMGEVSGGNLYDDEANRAGTPPDAETYYVQGLDLLRDIGNDSELAKGLERFGRYKVERGDVAAGRNLLNEALAIFARLGMQQQGDVERVLTSI